MPPESIDYSTNFSEVFEQYKRLVCFMVRKSFPTTLLDDLEEYDQRCYVAVYRAWLHFDPARGNKFKTTFYTAVRNEIRDIISLRKTRMKWWKDSEYIKEDDFQGTLLEMESLEYLLDQLLIYLTPPEKEFVSTALTNRWKAKCFPKEIQMAVRQKISVLAANV